MCLYTKFEGGIENLHWAESETIVRVILPMELRFDFRTRYERFSQYLKCCYPDLAT